ncbi:MAG TPA: HupE/UreJ family protein [Pseudolabrys sp.]|nr:HupE/UreJ family protein [Pseudolabrys sp.]
MNLQFTRLGSILTALVLSAGNASAHHIMGGRTPATFGEGMLSGLGHPIIGLDHFAAVVAVGCIAAMHSAGAALVIAFIVSMMAGVALHLNGATVPAAEILVALSVIALGVLMLGRRQMSAISALVLFALVGLVHGYALGESIYGAEQTPLYAYLLGLAVIQSAIALVAMAVARSVAGPSRDLSPLRLVGAGIAGIGLAVLMQQVVPAV